MRAANQQSISEGLAQRIGALSAGLAELSEYVQLVTRNPSQDFQTAAIENHTSTKPIEFVTENGFVIVRPWEADGSPAQTGGSFHFLVCDPHNTECEVTVNVAAELCAETAFYTRGRIEGSSSFWICCAERRLADYLSEHNILPEGEKLTVDCLDPEEMMLALRWERFD